MPGNIVIFPKEPHSESSAVESEVAHILAKYSQKPVEILAPRTGYKLKTPDLIMDGNMWEIKSTCSIKQNSIKDLIKRATRQSKYIVIDTRTVKKPNHKIITTIKNISSEYASIQKLLCILPNDEVIVLKPLKDYNGT
mgnify:CR=1 FL=1